MENLIEACKAIDSVGIPEIYEKDGDPMLPRYGVVVFFQTEGEARAFHDSVQART